MFIEWRGINMVSTKKNNLCEKIKISSLSCGKLSRWKIMFTQREVKCLGCMKKVKRLTGLKSGACPYCRHTLRNI